MGTLPNVLDGVHCDSVLPLDVVEEDMLLESTMKAGPDGAGSGFTVPPSTALINIDGNAARRGLTVVSAAD